MRSVNKEGENNIKKIIFVIVICSLFLAGCKSKNVIINYQGKSQNWNVAYKIDGNDKAHNSYYTFKFTGNENKPENEIRYLIDGPKEGEDGKFSIDKNNEYTDKMRITGGIPSESDRDIKVTIEWNGKTETVVVKRLK
jgi:hypothetical protein